MVLITDRLIIEAVSIQDAENIHRLLSCPETDEFNTFGIPESIEKTKMILQRMLSDDNLLTWKIRIKEVHDFIGIAGLEMSNNNFNVGKLYYILLPMFWNNGYATEITKEVINFGFNVLKLHRIEAGVVTNNFRSIKVIEKSNMSREGIRRKYTPIKGDWKDSFLYAIIEDDN